YLSIQSKRRVCNLLHTRFLFFRQPENKHTVIARFDKVKSWQSPDLNCVIVIYQFKASVGCTTCCTRVFLFFRLPENKYSSF
ncbi:MAG: hypothetical protein J6U05_02025, partial [Neisseriaceae bacterium]|nr:hypothetical protein [Neisseriaceae bacterium]